MRTAILVDGAFFLKRYRCLYKNKKEFNPYDPVKVAKDLYTLAHKHVENEYLYRILYYDCMPFSKKAHNPITSKAIDFAKSNVAKFKLGFYEELKKKRKVALRLGEVKDRFAWIIRPDKTKSLLKGKITVNDLEEDDVFYDIRQKGVDIRMGLDIASLAYKRLVDQIVLVTGDSDFVPAAKLARREGIDVILDPMRHHIDNALFEHIDGLKTFAPKLPSSPC
ncbi:hypothetical protein ES702_03953 [subsurface metagenome]